MRLGHKGIGEKRFDFDQIYGEVFEPAIKAVPLLAPESGIDYPDLQHGLAEFDEAVELQKEIQ